MRKFNHTMAAYALASSLLLVLAGCGGGGGGGSDDMMTTTPTPTPTCPDGQVGTPPNCRAPGPSQADIDAEAMRVGGALSKQDNIRTTLPTGAAEARGKVTVGTTATSFKVDADANYTSLGTGFMSNAYTQTNRNVTVEGVLYNNIDPPTAARYAAFFGSDSNDDPAFVTGAQVTEATHNGQLTFTESGFSAGDHSNRFMFSGFAGTPGTNFDLPNVNNAQTPGNDNERAGSFFGIDGKFRCTGSSACNARVGAKGALTFTGNWLFIPDNFVLGAAASSENNNTASGTMVEGVVLDTDYAVFGYWLEKTTARDNTMTYKVNLYQKGVRAYDVGPSEGTATYEGPATGIYMKKTVNPDGAPISPFSSGQFTADAMLTASFGGGTVGSDHVDTVIGTIRNFRDSNNALISDWVLTLDRSGTINSSGAFTSTASTSEGRTTGGTVGYTGGTRGQWAGTFYGPPREDGTPVKNPHPAGVTGTFNGHFRNGHVAGAFGATKKNN